MKKLTLYVRDGCHLCEEMRIELEAVRERFGFELRTRNVDAEPRWRERYGLKVPVLALGDEEVCHYFLDHEALDRVLRDGN